MWKIILIILISLILGAGIGYIIGGSKTHPVSQVLSPSSEHMAGMEQATSTNEILMTLQEKKGDARDQEYLEGMIAHHQSAVEMSKLVLETTKRQELKDLAGNIIAAQTQEIEQMRGWMRDWYGR